MDLKVARMVLLSLLVLLLCYHQYLAYPLHAIKRATYFMKLGESEVNMVASIEIETEVEKNTMLESFNTKVVRGQPHTEESKAKISAANKGRKPWNAGKKHSEETRRKIAEKTKEAMLKRKIKVAESLGMTVEEYDNRKVVEKRAKKAAKVKTGLTEEGRKRISESLKKRWQDPEYRARLLHNPDGTRINRTHSLETREKISASIKAKWQEEEYRNKICSISPTQEVRERISKTLKDKWQDPEFRNRMLASSFPRTDEWREAISLKIRAKWEEEGYRVAVTNGIRRSVKNGNRTSTSRRSARSSRKVYRTPEEKAAIKAMRDEQRKQRREKEKAERAIIKAAKIEKLGGDVNKDSSIKELLGGQLWFEEKMKRRKDSDTLIDDDELERILLEEWDNEKLANLHEAIKAQGDHEEEMNDGDDDEGDSYDDDYDVDYEYEEEELDVIEVYDEDGNLVATYDSSEYDKLKN